MDIDVGTRMYWTSHPKEVYVVTEIVPQGSLPKSEDFITIGGGDLPEPVDYYRKTLCYLIEEGHVKIVLAEVAPAATAIAAAPPSADDCPECWGTGYYKGCGMVCSKGCHAPAEAAR